MTITVETELVPVTCCTCGILFGVPVRLIETRREDACTFYCPNGHGQSFRTSAKDAEIKRLTKLAADAEARRKWAETDRDDARRAGAKIKKSLIATKGQLTRTRRRVGTGTCPCCGLGIVNLREHMQEQHPEYGGKDQVQS